MGCCFSSEEKDPKHLHGSNHSHPPEPLTTRNLDNRAPPPNPEEETVKEVLSETPIPKPPTPITDDTKPQIPSPNLQEDKPEANAVVTVKPEDLSEVSQVSEMYSITASETFSVSTQTTVREEEAISANTAQVGAQRNSRSPAKVRRKRPYSGELTSGRERVAKSPARRAEPSPEKRRAQAGQRTVRGRDAGRIRNAPRHSASRVVRRDSGDVSSRRSRSPATRMGNGASRDGVGKAPAKLLEKPCERLPETGKEKKEEEAKVEVSQQGNKESIENPLVSLECFIFL